LFTQVLEIWSQPREPLGVRASVAGGAEIDGVKTCSGFRHRLLSASAIGRMLATNSIHPDQQHDGDDGDQNNSLPSLR
jgi:hypothetical protein